MTTFVSALVLVVLFAIYRGHSISLGLRMGPKKRKR
jgi:hypothetical protein